MERSSCSSDVPFVAATCFRRSTTSSSMFLIMTCAMIHRNRVDSGHAITVVGDSNDNRRFRQVSRQILSGGIDRPWRVVSSSGDGEHIAEGGDSLDMDRPSPGRGHVLLAPGGRSEEVAHLVMSPAEAGGAGVRLEASHRPEAPFYPSVILFQMVV